MEQIRLFCRRLAVAQNDCAATSRRLSHVPPGTCTHIATKQHSDMRLYAESALDIMLVGARLAAAHRRS